MYFSSKIEIDPSQITLIKKVKPSKLFGKLLDVLTFGAATEKQEHETFTAVSIIQQINMALRSLDVKNVIRLAIDEYDFYLDEQGIDDDLDHAMLEFKAKADPIESELFNILFLVLEHLENSLKYLIEIGVSRKHKVGEYPIIININSVLADFKLKKGESTEDLQKRIDKIFTSQQNYDSFIQSKWFEFNNLSK